MLLQLVSKIILSLGRAFVFPPRERKSFFRARRERTDAADRQRKGQKTLMEHMNGLDSKIMEMASRIRELREIVGMSVAEMAKRTDVSEDE